MKVRKVRRRAEGEVTSRKGGAGGMRDVGRA